MQQLDEADPIWGEVATVYRDSAFTRYVVSNRCGSFHFGEGFAEHIRNWPPSEKAKICTYILNANRAGETPTITPREIAAIQIKRPVSLSSKIDNFLLMLDRNGFRPGDPLPWRMGGSQENSEIIKSRHQTMLWIEAASENEFYAFGNMLVDAGILARDDSHRYSLTLAGYDRMEAINKRSGDGDQAFVAMWFDPIMNEAYVEGIEPAIVDCGYSALRIDRKEHSNKIDDEIIAEIRRSRFIVADFTTGVVKHDNKLVCIVRGGVYYEAGFALGLGLPVIWCVRGDQVDQVHFDTRQFNHIVWSNPSDLRVKLYNRISAIIGNRKLNPI